MIPYFVCETLLFKIWKMYKYFMEMNENFIELSIANGGNGVDCVKLIQELTIMRKKQ